jgi:GRASP55/65 PDZ-like domain
MGNAASSNVGTAARRLPNDADDDADDADDPFDGVDTLGYRVLGVQPNSPASKAGLVSFLDFLIGCNDKMLLGSGEDLLPGMEYDDIDLPTLLLENKDKELEFCKFIAICKKNAICLI